MNWSVFKQRFAYHYKKYLAIIFAIVAFVLLIGSGVASVLEDANTGTSLQLGSIFSIWNFVLLGIAYLLLLSGNIQGANYAYTGMLMYVFMQIWTGVQLFLLGGVGSLASLFSGSVGTIVVTSLILLCYVALIVGGIMSYLRTSQYLRNSYSDYPKMRNWCLLFCIANIVVNGLTPVLFLVAGYSPSILLSFLDPLSQVFISLAIFFTVARLKSEF